MSQNQQTLHPLQAFTLQTSTSQEANPTVEKMFYGFLLVTAAYVIARDMEWIGGLSKEEIARKQAKQDRRDKKAEAFIAEAARKGIKLGRDEVTFYTDDKPVITEGFYFGRPVTREERESYTQRIRTKRRAFKTRTESDRMKRRAQRAKSR